jgi:hypothetical protein
VKAGGSFINGIQNDGHGSFGLFVNGAAESVTPAIRHKRYVGLAILVNSADRPDIFRFTVEPKFPAVFALEHFHQVVVLLRSEFHVVL